MSESISLGPISPGRDRAPLDRLHVAGSAGLPVGRGARAAGGLRSDTAERLAAAGLARLQREAPRDDRPGVPGRPVRAHAAQGDLFR